ncbi:cytochrome P450, partial [Apodospora peruviana]
MADSELFSVAINELGWLQPLLLLAISQFVLYSIYDSHAAGINHIPGPFWARYTNLHAFISTVRAGKRGDYLIPLHEKYGDVVRVGPRTVSVADPDAVKVIYNSKLRLRKFKNIGVGRPFGSRENVATIRDADVHGQYRKPIANAYALSTLLEYQPVADKTIDLLFAALDRESSVDGKEVDVAKWLFFYAFDLVGNLSFGKPIGFLESGEDVFGLVRKQHLFADYVRLTMVMPNLHYLFLGNPLLRLFVNPAKNAFHNFSQRQIRERANEVFGSPKAKQPPGHGQRKPDLLSYFLDAREKYPLIMTEEQVVSTTIVNVFAGALATTSLYLMVHHLVTYPEAQKRLYNDMVALGVSTPVTWQETQKLPFLNGLVRESTRLHMGQNSLLGRDTPTQGLVLPNGMRLPHGVSVGIKPHVLHVQEKSFGEEPFVFKPERWCRFEGESAEDYETRKSKMELCDLSFGYGSRACIGQNIARLQMFKVVANLVWRYQV